MEADVPVSVRVGSDCQRPVVGRKLEPQARLFESFGDKPSTTKKVNKVHLLLLDDASHHSPKCRQDIDQRAGNPDCTQNLDQDCDRYPPRKEPHDLDTFLATDNPWEAVIPPRHDAERGERTSSEHRLNLTMP